MVKDITHGIVQNKQSVTSRDTHTSVVVPETIRYNQRRLVKLHRVKEHTRLRKICPCA
jgi:hypothetical protein